MATLTIPELAARLDTDARTTRKFLRNIAANDDTLTAPGKGGRWVIEAKKVQSLKSKFSKFIEGEATKRAEKDMHRETPNAESEVEDLETEIQDPTDEDLASIDDED